MRNKNIIGVSLIISMLLIGAVAYNLFLLDKPDQVLNGTFANQSDLYNYLIFDQRDHYTFYHVTSGGSIVDQGTYEKVSEGIYRLNSDKMKDVKLHDNGKTLEIVLDDIAYVFKKTHNQPIIQVNPTGE